MALVVDPSTNEILVWAQNPRVQRNGSLFRNFGATDPIEPGSVMKPLLMSWALEKSLVHEKTVFQIPNAQLKVGDKVFKDAGHKARDHFTPEEILKYSSNVGAVSVGQRIGFRGVWEILEKLGFTEKSGLQLSSESRGILHKPLEYQKVEQATMSFGQGFASTPLQIVRAFSVLAGDGYLRPLKLFKDLNLPHEEKGERVLSPKTLSRIRKLMEAALSDGGTAMSARVEGYSVAGKTGTALVSEGASGYKNNRFQSSFVGYFPAENPQYTIAVIIINRPNNPNHFGASVAGPVWKEIADRLYSTYIHNKLEVAPSFKLKDSQLFNYALSKSNFNNITKHIQISYQDSSLNNDWLQVHGVGLQMKSSGQSMDDKAMPNIIGMKLQDAIWLCEKMGLMVKCYGKGKVISQSLMQGQAIIKGQQIQIQLN
jgi:cell division protein FtsI (penicillin-binding protein 3)